MITKEQQAAAECLSNKLIELKLLVEDAKAKGISVELGIGGAYATSGLHYRIYTTPMNIEVYEQANEPVIVKCGDGGVELGV